MRTKVSLNRRAVAIFLAVVMVTGMFGYNLRFASADGGSIDPTEPASTYEAKTEPLEPQTSSEVPEPSKEPETSPEASKGHEKTPEDITEPETATEASTEPESTTEEPTTEEPTTEEPTTEEPTTEETTEPTTAEPPATTEPDGNDNIKDKEITSCEECEADEDECECDDEVEAVDTCEECEADEDECECDDEVEAVDICEKCWDMDSVGAPPHDHCKCNAPAIQLPIVRMSAQIDGLFGVEAMSGIASINESEFTKTVRPDPDNFREYIVELEFTPQSSSITRYIDHEIDTVYCRAHLTTRFIDIGGTGGTAISRAAAAHNQFQLRFPPRPSWTTGANVWGSLPNVINSINNEITRLNEGLLIKEELLPTGITRNDASLFNFNNEGENGVIYQVSPDLPFPLYIEWRAFVLNDRNEVVGMKKVLRPAHHNVEVTADGIVKIAQNDAELNDPTRYGFNAFSPIVANVWSIGQIDEIDGVRYMWININNAKNPKTGSHRFTYATTSFTTVYNTAQITAINNPIPDGFELVPGSVISTSDTDRTITNFNEISNLRFSGDSWISYRIQPIRTASWWISGIKGLSVGKTSFTMTTLDANGIPSGAPKEGDAAVEANTFNVPPLVQIGMTIVGKTDSSVAKNGQNDSHYATITSHKDDFATLKPTLVIHGTSTPVSAEAVTGYTIPPEWLQYYNPLNYAISIGMVPEGSNVVTIIPGSNVVTDQVIKGEQGSGISIGKYTFTFSVTMPNNYYNPLTTVTLEVIPHIIYRLNVEVVGLTPHLDTADVAIKHGNSVVARFAGFAGTLADRSRTYTVDNLTLLNSYTVDAYVPYGYHATPNNNSQVLDAHARPAIINGAPEERVVTRTITVTVKNSGPLPFYRDIATGGGG